MLLPATLRATTPVNLGIRLFKSLPSLPMPLQTPTTCSSACALMRGSRSALRLVLLLGAQGFRAQALTHLAQIALFFCSAVSNSASKQTRILRTAYVAL